MKSDRGRIYFVGTGPGEEGLITVKGLALVREAEVIVGDALGHAKLLQEARAEVEMHDVGRRAARNKVPQEQVNRLLLDLARQGKMVVRLWPGDPFVFGRAAQEMAVLRQAGFQVELVPGITSAIAAPAYAGVPVTHWEYATSFAVVTGYASKNPNVRPDWTALAGVETLVILMPLENLSEIVGRLLAAGRAANTPAVAVQQGTLPQQKQVSATLETIEAAVRTHQIETPAIVVVGQAASLAAELNWYQANGEYPLIGRRVLVTRPRQQAIQFMAALRSLGAEPISFPTIEIRPVADRRTLDRAIRSLAEVARPLNRIDEPAADDQPPYDWLVLTSVNGVTAFWERLRAAGFDSRALAAVKVAAIGPATAEALIRHGIAADLVPETFTAEGVLEAFDRMGSVASQRFLLARADIAREALAEGLEARGAQIEALAAYRTVPLEAGFSPPFAEIVTFTSSSTVRGYVNCLGGRSPGEVLRNSQVVCIGPITAATARDLDVPISAVAESYTIEGMLDTLKALKFD
jgi:uroporphyrinogen III methyltransferase/synthase